MPLASSVVLTAAPGSGAVTDALAGAAQEALAAYGAEEARWLAHGDAWEVRVAADAGPPAVLRAAAAHAVGSAPVDVNVVPENGRKRLLAADMESTIIAEELVDELADLAGCGAEIAAITAAAMRGEIDFAASLRRRVALLAGFEACRLDEIRARVTLMPGAETLVLTMAAHGARTALVSGGFTVFAEDIARRLGFDTVVANVLEIADGRLTGRVREPILGPDGKADALKRLAAAHGLDLAETLAVGDGANDVAMLAAAGLGVAFRAKPMLAAAARAAETGAVVTHGDLTALLHLQGYTRDAFVTP